MRDLLYLRQSDSRGEGKDSLSLDSQEAILRADSERDGATVVDVIKEPDLKGWMDETERAGIADALQRAERGEYDRLRFYDLSRFARSVRIQEQLIHQLAQHQVTIASHAEPFASTPLFRQILGAIAEEGTRTISRHVARAVHERKKRGLYWGSRLPFGYARDRERGLAPHPDTADLARDLLCRYAAGANANVLGEELDRRGIRTPSGGSHWQRGTIRKMARNPVYAGYLVLDGELVRGQHAPLIDEATWQALQARQTAHYRPPRRKAATSWLEGLLFHAAPCGQRLYLRPERPDRQPRFQCENAADWRVHERGLCPVTPGSLSAPQAERMVRELLASDLGHLLPLADVLAEAERAYRAVHPLADRQRRDLIERRQRLAGRRARAEDLYLSGSRSRAWFDGQDALVGAELARVEADLAALPAAPDPDRIAAEAAHLGDAAALVRDPALPAAGLRAILEAAGVVELGPDGVRLRYRPAVAALVGRATSAAAGAGSREAMFARAAVLREAGWTWGDVLAQVQAEYPAEAIGTANALMCALRRRRK